MTTAAYVMVVNAGSSSLKYSLVDADSGAAAGSGIVERIGEASGRVVHRVGDERHTDEQPVADHVAALRLALAAFDRHGPSLADHPVAAVGHRVVHGGDRFSAPVLVTDALVSAIRELVPLAPLHNSANVEGIESALALFDDVPHVAVFDTAFHQSLPPHAYTYAIPRSWTTDHGIRRYGFHGTSVQFVSREAAALLGKAEEECRLIVLHLGNGASATAVDGGASVETSMGFTPLEGLVMGTRSGDVDPAIIGYLARTLGWSAEEVDRRLNRESGIKGLVGYNDFRELDEGYVAGDPDATLALEVYCHRIRKYVGAYYAVLGRVDAVVFTGGIGENDEYVRARSLHGLEGLGIELDPAANDVRSKQARTIATGDSRVAVLVVPTNEEWEIARQSLAVATAVT